MGGREQVSSGRVRHGDGEGDRALGRLPALDGLRAVAVVLTSLVHLIPGYVPGGFFGVDVFFVLSGFLITSILLSSARNTGIDLRRFYLRRLRRLLPAVVLLLVVFTAVVVLSSPTRRDLLVAAVVDGSVLLYAFNWIYPVGYQAPWQMDHLWSLSVEEQFYLLWPLVLIVALLRLTRRQIVALTAAAAAWSSLAQSGVFLTTGSDTWAFYATPLHASGILLGCLLAEIYIWGLADRPLRWLATREWPAWLGLAALVALSLVADETDLLTYAGGMALAVLAAAVVIACLAAHDAAGSTGPLTRLLSTRVLVALGRRSYSVYLWQNYFAWAFSPLRETVWYVPANAVATLLAAEVSYRLVELRFITRPVGDTGQRGPADPGPEAADGNGQASRGPTGR